MGYENCVFKWEILSIPLNKSCMVRRDSRQDKKSMKNNYIENLPVQKS